MIMSEEHPMKRFQSDADNQPISVPVILCDRVRDRLNETTVQFKERVVKAFANLAMSKDCNVIKVEYAACKLIAYAAVLTDETSAQAAERVLAAARGPDQI